MWLSRWGMIAVALYFSLTAVMFFEVANCLGLFCRDGIAIAVLPWILIFDNGIKLSGFELTGKAWLWTAFIVNTIVLYLAFTLFESRIMKRPNIKLFEIPDPRDIHLPPSWRRTFVFLVLSNLLAFLLVHGLASNFTFGTWRASFVDGEEGGILGLIMTANGFATLFLILRYWGISKLEVAKGRIWRRLALVLISIIFLVSTSIFYLINTMMCCMNLGLI